jgi:hypothetical protein
MSIEEYHFGSITIDGKVFNHDVEVRWTGEVLPWKFRERHIIDAEEVKRAIDQNPETIIIGTGESGMAEVTEKAKKEIESKGIELIIDITGEAIKTFNILLEESKIEEGKQKRVIGLFHLTC